MTLPLLNDPPPTPPRPKRIDGPFPNKGEVVDSFSPLGAPVVPFNTLSPTLPLPLTPPVASFATSAGEAPAIDEILLLGDERMSERSVRYPPPGVPGELVDPLLKLLNDDFEYDFGLPLPTLLWPFNMPPVLIPIPFVPSFRPKSPEIAPAAEGATGAGTL